MGMVGEIFTGVMKAMVVSVQFHGAQRALTQSNEIRVPLSGERRVSDVLLYIKNSYPELELNGSDFLVTVNNKVSTMNGTLNPNDKITFLPHIGGG